MTDKQKSAVMILNKVREHLAIEEYFEILDFIVNSEETKIEYVPVQNQEPIIIRGLETSYVGSTKCSCNCKGKGSCHQ